MTIQHRIAVLLGLLALAQLRVDAKAAELSTNDWPQFRRDAGRTGDNPQATLSFPLKRTTALRFPAPLYASPAVADGRVYIQDARGNIACIDSAKNKTVWVTSLGGINNTSSPAVADGKVFVGNSANTLFILDAGTGKVLSKVQTDGGVLTAPAVANQAVYFSTFHGKLVKIDFAGKVQWTFDGGQMSSTEFAIRDRDILFFAGTKTTYLYRLRDEGTQVKVVQKTAAPTNCCPTAGPVFVTDDSFAFQSFDSECGRFYLMKDQAKPLVAGDISDSRSLPAVRGDLIYRGDKCFDAATLKQVWRADPQVLYDGGFHSSPALAKDVLVVGCEQGMIHAFDLKGTKVQKPRWQYKTERAGQPDSAVSSSPAVVDGKIFFGGEDSILYGLGQGTEVAVADVPVTVKEPAKRIVLKGSEWPTPGGDMGFSCVSTDRAVKPPYQIEWQTRLWSVFKAPMIVADGRVYCGGRLGNFTALDAATGEILWKTHHPGVESRPAPTYTDGKLLIVDNNSPIHPLLSRLRRLDGVSVRRWGRNRGFARAVNEGVRLSRGEWVLLLNPDVTVSVGFVEEALNRTEDLQREANVGIVGFGLRDGDGSRQGSTGPFPTLWRTLTGLLWPRARRKYHRQPLETRCAVEWVTGCCLLTRRSCLADVGGLDTDFFLYYEDVDLCQRAQAKGWQVWYDPSLEITHHTPLHRRPLTPLLRMVTRHALLKYAGKHWPGWQRRFLGHGIALEATLRRWWAVLRNKDTRGEQFDELRAMALAAAKGNETEITAVLHRVLRQHETPRRKPRKARLKMPESDRSAGVRY